MSARVEVVENHVTGEFRAECRECGWFGFRGDSRQDAQSDALAHGHWHRKQAESTGKADD